MLTVRPARQDDRARWEELFDAYAAFYRTRVDQPTCEEVWSWIHDPSVAFWCALAERDGASIGLTHYQAMLRSLSGRCVCYMSDLYVEPAVRGSGAGLALIDHVRDFAAAEGMAVRRMPAASGPRTAPAMTDPDIATRL